MGNKVSAAPAMNDSARNALTAYRDQLERDCGGDIDPAYKNDKDAAAMLIADLIQAFPAVENEWQGWSA
jgi:hypothetical protein